MYFWTSSLKHNSPKLPNEMRLSTIILLSLTVIISSSFHLVSCWRKEQKWIDDKIRKPKNFKAFNVQPEGSNSCIREIIFERDFNDQTYEYNVYAVFSTGKIYYLPPVSYLNSSNLLAVVDPNPPGQRGAYFLNDSYTLLPIFVNICDIGKNDSNFPKELRGIKPTKFKVEVIPYGAKHVYPPNTWDSNVFLIQKNQLTPQNGGVSNLIAKVNSNNPNKNHKNITVTWKNELPSNEIKAFFILVGPTKIAKHIQNFRIDNSNLTQAIIDIGYFTENYDVSVIVWNSVGALTSPTSAPQVRLQQA